MIKGLELGADHFIVELHGKVVTQMFDETSPPTRQEQPAKVTKARQSQSVPADPV
jgi:hypothetical protein